MKNKIVQSDVFQNTLRDKFGVKMKETISIRIDQVLNNKFSRLVEALGTKVNRSEVVREMMRYALERRQDFLKWVIENELKESDKKLL